MIDIFFLNGYPIAVMGLGKSGLTTAEALVRSGAEVRAWDDNARSRTAAAEAGIPLFDLGMAELEGVTSLVLSPGIPHTHPAPHPVAARARASGLEIIGDIELLARAQRDAAYVGITGTNGKSTTTALIGHILHADRRDIEVGGNLGTPVLGFRPLGAGGTYVLEMSSYQLDLTFSITFDVAVLTNISPDHLDRHGGMDGYVAAKRQIFHRQTRPRTAVIGVDDPWSRQIHADLVRQNDQVIVPVSAERPVAGGVYAPEGVLIDDTDGTATAIVDLRTIATLPGRHNWQNAAAAYAATKACGVAPAAIVAAMRSFPGLEHRQQRIAEIQGIRYVNDSKATNADAAAKALVCYDDIYWIIGGRPKENGLSGLESCMSRVRHAFVIGEATEAFAVWLEANGVPYQRCSDLINAVYQASMAARADRLPGATVLLSPACASFDQFTSFESRGKTFAAVVATLQQDLGQQDLGQQDGGHTP